MYVPMGNETNTRKVIARLKREGWMKCMADAMTNSSILPALASR